MTDDYAEMLRELEENALDMREVARLRAIYWAAERQKVAIHQRIYGCPPPDPFAGLEPDEPMARRRVPARKHLERRRSAA